MLREIWKTTHDVLREELIKEMDKSDIDFHLTGSRYFRAPNLFSDIDFFTEDKVETRNFLTDIGFIAEKNSHYNGVITDINTAVVYRNLNARIDVQLIKNVQLKIDIQNWMKENDILPPQTYNKEFQRNWWDEQYKVYLFEQTMNRKEKEQEK